MQISKCDEKPVTRYPSAIKPPPTMAVTRQLNLSVMMDPIGAEIT